MEAFDETWGEDYRKGGRCTTSAHPKNIWRTHLMNLAATLAIEHLDSRTASQDLDKLAREIPEFREYLVRHARDEARHAETILEIIAETGIVPDVEAAQETIAALHAAGLGWDK